MSHYYKQDFISASPLYAEVKEDLRPYFASGAIDDLLFPIWTEQCLKRFKKSAFKIMETVLQICDYEVCLPDDFNSVREAWACNTFFSEPVQDPASCYYTVDCAMDAPTEDCDTCSTTYHVMHKVTNHVIYKFSRTALLTPGNIHTKAKCGECCKNTYAHTQYSFDIHSGKMVVNFPDGLIHLLYYAETLTDEGEQLVPDNFYIQEYIKKYIIYKCYYQLSNRVTDESFNQIQSKKQEADREQAEAFIIASTEMKKDTPADKIRKIGKSYRSFNKYRLGGNGG